MSALQSLLKNLNSFLSDSAVFSSFPASLLLIGLKDLMELNLACPCRSGLNKALIICIFVGPFIFMFALMFVLFSPFRPVCYQCADDTGFCSRLASCLKFLCHLCTCCKCSSKDRTEGQRSCFKALGRCAIPSLVWILILLLDGDYLACFWTDWEGKYVFYEQINRKWCEPIDHPGDRNKSKLQQEFQAFISQSQVYGYAVLALFGLLILVTVGLFECCRRTHPEEHDEEQDGAQKEAEGMVHDSKDRVQSDEHASAEKQPQIEMKPLLISTAKHTKASV